MNWSHAEVSRILMVILAHDDAASLGDLVENTRRWCPKTQLLLYNSGDHPDLGADLDIERFPRPRQFRYAKITPFFFHLFNWLANENFDYDYVLNLETDLLFIRPGFEDFLTVTMRESDYMVANLFRRVSPKSRWRPYRSLKPELSNWYRFLGFQHVNGGFSPAQVFSRRYVETMLTHEKYSDLIRLVEENQSFTLQEVLFPTLPEFLGLPLRSYPDELRPIVRYRPYQAISGIKRALSIPSAHFVHPVRRTPVDPARRLIMNIK